MTRGVKIDPRTTREGLLFIREHIESMGYPPSLSQVANHCGLNSKASAMRALRKLEEDGLLERDAGVVRGMRITKAGMKATTEPM